jgi:hypothetical protein
MTVANPASVPSPPRVARPAGRRMRLGLLLGLGITLAACAAAQSPVETALSQAQKAVQAKDGAAATAALDRAQNAWQTANISVENPQFPQEGTALQQIGEAREAVRQQQWDQASYYIKAAMDHASDLTPQ